MPSLKSGEEKTQNIERWAFDVSDFVSHVAWSHNDLFVAVSLASGSIKIFNSKDGSHKTLSGHEFGTMEISWSPDNFKLASAGQDGKIKIWDVETQKTLKTLQGGVQWVEHISWSPNGDFIASSAGKILRIWSPNGNLIQEYKDHPSTITAMQWNSASTEIATASYGKVLIFLIGISNPQKVLLYPSSLISLSWHLNGKWIVAGTQEGSICGWQLPNVDESRINIQGYETKVTQLSWNKNGENLATVGGRSIVIWDFSGRGPEGRKPKVLGNDKRVTQLSYQNCGDLLTSGTKDGSIIFWRHTEPKKPILVFEVDSEISHLRWSNDGSSLAICSDDGVVRAWKSPRV